MKTLQLAAFALALAAGVVRADDNTNATPKPVHEFSSQQRAIIRVLHERLLAMHNATHTLKTAKGIRVHLNPALFFKRMKEIKMDGLPKDFHLAWFDYMTAWEQHKKDQVMVLFEGAEAIASHGLLANKLAEGLAKAERDDPNLAWRAVERASLVADIDPDRVHLTEADMRPH